MVALDVPFQDKSLYRNAGAKFDKQARTFYADTEAEARRILAEVEEGKEESSKEPSATEEEPSLIAEESITPGGNYWESHEIPDSTLLVAEAILKHGMPRTSEERARVLTALARRDDGQYPVEYAGMISASEDFRRLYDEDTVTALLRRIPAGGDYSQQIYAATLTDEERALLLFVLPF